MGTERVKKRGIRKGRRVKTIKTNYMHVWAYYNMKINCKENVKQTIEGVWHKRKFSKDM